MQHTTRIFYRSGSLRPSPFLARVLRPGPFLAWVLRPGQIPALCFFLQTRYRPCAFISADQMPALRLYFCRPDIGPVLFFCRPDISPAPLFLQIRCQPGLFSCRGPASCSYLLFRIIALQLTKDRWFEIRHQTLDLQSEMR